MKGWYCVESLAQDTRYALRWLRRSPGFTAVAVLSLALGIGANTAIFSLIDTVMLRQLPVAHPEQLVELLHRFPGEPRLNGFSWRAYRLFVDHNHVFSELIGTVPSPNPRGSSFNVQLGASGPEIVNGVYVTGGYFPVLGVRAALGRLIGPDDDRAGAPAPVAVVSWRWWKNRFNLDPSILGRRISLNNLPVTIVGVAAREFAGWRIDTPEDIWLPLALQPALNPANSYLHGGSQFNNLALVGRLKPGVSMEQARAEMAVLYQQTVPRSKSRNAIFQQFMRFEMEPAGAGLSGVRDHYARPLLALMAGVAILLLIACANLASLLLARATARQREMALRVSLGAGRSRLARQMLTEALVLSAAGALLGMCLAYAGVGMLLRIISSGRDPVSIHVHPDLRVLLFTAGLALCAAVLFGFAPALRAWGTAPAAPLRDAGPAGETRLRRHFARGLVAAQVAFSVVLLAAGGLWVSRLEHIYSGLGFRRDHVLLVHLNHAGSGYPREQLAGPYRELLKRLQAIPGVRSATLSAITPVQGPGANRDATVEGYTPRPGELRYIVENWVGPKYFETFGIPLLRGRDFRFEDQGRPRVAIVNQAMVRFFFGSRDPIGKHVLFDGDTQPYEIIGIAGDAKYGEAAEVTPRTIFFNAFQEGGLPSQFALRSTVPPLAVARQVRRAASDVVPGIPVDRVTTLSDQVNASLVPERLIANLSGWFGALGSLLVAIGFYGLLAYAVARRVNEIGIRMALGASGGAVTRMVLREALGMVGAGFLLAVPLGYAGSRLAGSLIPDLPTAGALPFFFGGAAIALVALAAAYLPARRAARTDPMHALRYVV